MTSCATRDHRRKPASRKGEYTRVLAVNAQENTLTVLRANGEQTTYDPRRQMGVSVYREKEKSFSVGDRIQFTAPNQELKIANRDLGTVESIAQDGTMRLRLDNERSIDFNPQRHPHLDHGYAVTSYSSQGQTADRVLGQRRHGTWCEGPAQQPHGVCLDLARPMGRADLYRQSGEAAAGIRP